MSEDANDGADDDGVNTDGGTVTAAGGTQSTDPQPAVPVGVKLGSTRTVISRPDREAGEDLIRTLTCLATYEDALTGEEKVLYGGEAATEYPDRVQFMLRSGLPEDADRADLTQTFFEALIAENELPQNSAVVYAIPTIDNPRGLDNLRYVIEDSSIGNGLVESYPESLCGAIPPSATTWRPSTRYLSPSTSGPRIWRPRPTAAANSSPRSRRRRHRQRGRPRHRELRRGGDPGPGQHRHPDRPRVQGEAHADFCRLRTVHGRHPAARRRLSRDSPSSDP